MTLIFDYDGTLHNTLPLYAPALRGEYARLVAEGLAPERELTDKEIGGWLGYNARDMWQGFLPELPPSRMEEAARRVGAAMEENITRYAAFYPGVEETLDVLYAQGHQMVILSNCKTAYLEAHRRHFGLEKWFAGFYPCEAYGFVPKEEIYPHIARRFSGPYVMIGDRASDLKVGIAHGFPAIACAYGFGEPKEWKGAAAVMDSIRQLPAILAKPQQLRTVIL